MNTSEHIPTMYESIPAVSALNRVPGFEPFKLLRRIVSPEDGKEVLQLDLRYKKLWFRLANPKGRIRLNPLRITEQMAVFEAQVYLDRSDENPVGSFTSCFTKEESPDGRYVQAAQFEAMDEALTDAGYGVQFADVSVDRDGNRYGSRAALSDTVSAGQEGTGNSGVQTAQRALQTKKEAPTDATPVQASGMQDTGSPAGVAQAVTETAETIPNVSTAVPGQKRNPAVQEQAAGNALPISPGNPVSGGRVSRDTVGDNKGTTAQRAVSATAQAGKPAVEKRVVQDSRMMQPGTVKEAAGQQTAAPQGQNRQAVGSARAFHPVMAQGQRVQVSANGKDVRQNQTGTMRTPAAQVQTDPDAENVLPAAPATEIKKPVQPSENGLPIQPESMKSQTQPNAVGALPVNAAGAGSLPVQSGTMKRETAVMETLPVDAAGINSLPIQPITLGTDVTAAQTLPSDAAGINSLPIQPGTEKREASEAAALPINTATADSLPMQPGTMKRVAAATEILPVNTTGTDSLPAQAAAEKTAVVSGRTVQASGKGNGSGQLQNSVQGAMALLGGQKTSIPAAASSGAGQKPASAGAGQTGQALPVSGNMATGGPAPRYTADMPVEEIVKLMTFEEAGKVVVDTGVCKGQTIAEVAERRPPSLKFYLYGGYKGDNNILRAAAQIMLDSLAAQKAG